MSKVTSISGVRAGSQGHAVVAVQQLLTDRDHSLAADGALGNHTAAAIKTFQTEQHHQGLHVTVKVAVTVPWWRSSGCPCKVFW
ncbi:peptidoglycan-binding protein [Streptomyces sp. NPDC056831]|uniref:peptidoglycan-binding domain-containing protein n=1 Tax=Streptomyces sp. NPDC056831 TaxID=3345954 RepID=UPI003693950F